MGPGAFSRGSSAFKVRCRPSRAHRARVHDQPPQRRHQRQHEHRGITRRRLRAVVVVLQHLIAAPRIGVVIGVALQVEQQPVAETLEKRGRR